MGTIETMSIEEIVSAIDRLSLQERKTSEQALHRRSSGKNSTKRVLRQTFGLWSDREDITDSVEYVNDLRGSWSKRLRRLGIG